jgi:hypothetical protein
MSISIGAVGVTNFTDIRSQLAKHEKNIGEDSCTCGHATFPCPPLDSLTEALGWVAGLTL